MYKKISTTLTGDATNSSLTYQRIAVLEAASDCSGAGSTPTGPALALGARMAPPVADRTAAWGSAVGRWRAARNRRRDVAPPPGAVEAGRGEAGGGRATRCSCLFGEITETNAVIVGGYF